MNSGHGAKSSSPNLGPGYMTKIWMFVIALGLVVGSSSGCLVTLGTVVFLASSTDSSDEDLKEGWLERKSEFPMERVHSAVLDTLELNSLVVERATLDTEMAMIASEYGDSLDIQFELRRIDDSSCLIRIRVGPEGHLARSKHLLETVEKVLGAPNSHETIADSSSEYRD